MPDIANVRRYFTGAAVSFDSLYVEDGNSLSRFINRRFRRDIYERFALSLGHVRKFNLNSILDVGCGSGRYAAALAQLGVKRIVGLDVSEGMIALAERKASGERRPGRALEFVRGSFMEFEDKEHFELVLAMGFFDYVEDALPVLARMESLATHSVIASFPSISWYRTPIRKTRYLVKRCPVYFYQRAQIEELGRAAGFAQADVNKIEGDGQDYFVTFYK
jgi:2-polyprenyl-3-methyl-5-hydroxy-6-metoxy-1,4-benzoquinol methylase